MKSIHIVEKTLPLAWERAVIETWHNGDIFSTEYDKAGDPPSRDVTAMIHVTEPFSEPRIHRAFPGGLDDLEKYRAEVLLGVHDYLIDHNDKNKWQHTYHSLLFRYDTNKKCKVCGGIGIINLDDDEGQRGNKECLACDGTGGEKIDQVFGRGGIVEQLCKVPHTRRAQIITWQPWSHQSDPNAPCLQRMWFRVDQQNLLNMNIHIRSNDSFKAGYMNMYAFTELQKMVADTLGVGVGSYIHVADSFHIYGSYFNEFEGFLKMTQNRPMEDRVLSTDGVIPNTSERVRDFFVEGLDSLLSEPRMPEDKKQLVRERKTQLLQV